MFPAMNTRGRLRSAPSEREGSFGASFYKHYVATGRKLLEQPCQENKKLTVCFKEKRQLSVLPLSSLHFSESFPCFH